MQPRPIADTSKLLPRIRIFKINLPIEEWSSSRASVIADSSMSQAGNGSADEKTLSGSNFRFNSPNRRPLPPYAALI